MCKKGKTKLYVFGLQSASDQNPVLQHWVYNNYDYNIVPVHVKKVKTKKPQNCNTTTAGQHRGKNIQYPINVWVTCVNVLMC